MDAAPGFLQQGHQERRSATPLTSGATFTITPLDIGTPAVRPGVAIQVEQERQLLLTAAKLVLARIRSGNVPIGAVYEHALATAIKVAESGPR